MRRKIYLTLAIFSGLFLLLIVFVVRPLLKSINKNSAEILSQKNNLNLLQQESKNLNINKAIYQSYQPQLEKIDQLFISAEFPIDFINFLEKNAENSPLSMEISSMLAEKKEGEDWSDFVFQIKAAGSFEGFMKFLKKLENAPYLIEIKNLNITGPVEKAKNEIQANILMKVYSK